MMSAGQSTHVPGCSRQRSRHNPSVRAALRCGAIASLWLAGGLHGHWPRATRYRDSEQRKCCATPRRRLLVRARDCCVRRRRHPFDAVPWRRFPARRPAAARSTSGSSRTPKARIEVWWGNVNIPASDASFLACRQQALDHLGSRAVVYVVDGFAGWDPAYRIKVRVVCARAYHALFMHNLLIRPSPQELEEFGEPDFVIYNAGDQRADRRIEGVTSTTSVMLNLERREMVLLGTNYAGEMKKGVFTAMNYWMPQRGVLSMHCSANQGAERRHHALLRSLGHRQDHPLVRPAPPLDRRRRALLERPRDLQYRRGLLRQVPGPERRSTSRKSTGPSGSEPCSKTSFTTPLARARL